MLNETRTILAIIYRDFLCDDKTRKKLIERDKIEFQKLEIEKREKYNPDKLFENKRIKKESDAELKDVKDDNLSLIERKESIFSKIINKIKLFFKR